MTTPQPIGTASLPPQNLDAEESVLGAMMLAPWAIDAVAETVLRPAAFYRESHAHIYRAIITLHAKSEPVDAITVVDELDRTNKLEAAGGAERVHELAALVPAASNAAHYARIVADMATLRALIRAGNDIARLGFDRPDEIPELLNRAQAIVETLSDADHPSSDTVVVESWRDFERAAHDHIPVLVDGLWAEAGFGFVAAPPKKGKTWLALALAVSIATGTAFLERFEIPEPQPVLYVALEGHRAALRARTGSLARGAGIDPDGDGLDLLHWLYKPAGINLADPAWARRIHKAAEAVGARLVVVDVLRAAARIKENAQDEFSNLRSNLQPITDAGIAIAMLHHFGKLNETQKERDPGERMSGSGAMFGALDVAIYITASTNGARDLRLDFDTRDLAAPDHLHIHLEGKATGPNGGLAYRDTATFTLIDDDLDQDDVKAPATEIAEHVKTMGGDVPAMDVRAFFEISSDTLTRRLTRLHQLGVEYVSKPGKAARLVYTKADDDDKQNTNPQLLLDVPHEVPHGTVPHAEPSTSSRSTMRDSATVPHASASTLAEPPKTRDLQGKDTLRKVPLPTGGASSRGEAAPHAPKAGRAEREAWITNEGWQLNPNDLTTAILERWPTTATAEIGDLLKLAQQREREELGETTTETEA